MLGARGDTVRIGVLDIGSTTIKAAVMDAEGRVLAFASEPITTSCPAPMQVEQAPEQWMDGVRTVAKIFGTDGEITALTITGQMQTIVPVGANGPLGPALLYSDQRGGREFQRLAGQVGPAWGQAIGSAPDATMIPPKWAWLRTHRPELTRDTRHLLLGAHSFLVWWLTGRAACDPTTAATTGLADLRSAHWWSPILEAAQLPVELMPELIEPTEVTGHLLPGPARELQLPPGLPVLHAPGDALATTLGVIGDESDRVYSYLGTSGWVARTSAEPVEADGVIVLPALNRQWLAIGPLLSCGSALEWAARELLGGIDFAAAEVLAAHGFDADQQVIFLPHLDGSRVPFADATAGGALLGLRRDTTRAHLAAAVFEGVAQALRAIDEHIGLHSVPMTICGGGARSVVFSQVLADVLGREICVADEESATARGATGCALTMLGLRAPPPPPALSRSFPDAARHAVHRRRAAVFDQIGPVAAALLAEPRRD